MNGLTIGELAKQGGVNLETIRYYERRGFRAELASLIAQAPKLSRHEAEAQVCSIVEESPSLALSSVTTPTLSRKRLQKVIR